MVRVGLIALAGIKVKANAVLRQRLNQEQLTESLAKVEEEMHQILSAVAVTDAQEDAIAGED